MDLVGAPSSQAICIELCAGSARLSLTLRSKGFAVIAVDHSKNSHASLYPTVCIDLADDSSCEQLLQLLENPGYLIYVHAAPPCGTCSKARHRRISKELQARGVPDPKPLRSNKFPHGLPSLKGIGLKRVTTANSIYKNVAKFLTHFGHAIIFTIENPRNSYMWATKWMKDLIKKFDLIPIDFQQCMHGGWRDKWTRLYTNHVAFQSLQKTCDQSHEHLPWGVTTTKDSVIFNTSLEAEYPQILCDNISDVVVSFAQKKGILMLQPATKRRKTVDSRMRSAEGGRQPRGNLLPSIISEFKEIVVIKWPLETIPTAAQFTKAFAAKYHLPFPAKFLPFPTGDDRAKDHVQLGVWRSCKEFTQAAFECEHPFDTSRTVSDFAKQAMFDLFTLGSEELDVRRNDTFEYYERLAMELQPAEDLIHSKLKPHAEKILQSKKFLLLQRMADDAGVGDSGLAELMHNGVKLTGMGGASQLFESEEGQPALSDIQLMKSAKWNRSRILGKTSQEGSADTRRDVWLGAQEECTKGWLDGPFTREQLKELVGPLFVVSERFGIKQTDKTRSIDDMSQSLVNAAYTPGYRLDLSGIDGISVLARTMLECVDESGEVRLELSTGECLVGQLHTSITLEQARQLRGRTLDLDAAYKQMIVSDSSLWCSVLAIENESYAKHLFLSRALPFGASASVYEFSQLARAIHCIGERLFGLCWCNYYDDYPQLDLEICGNRAQYTAERLLDLLGWRFSCKEAKRQRMSTCFDALGVTFDFTQCALRSIVVRNKESRKTQIDL